jgi:hypothetical protein
MVEKEEPNSQNGGNDDALDESGIQPESSDLKISSVGPDAVVVRVPNVLIMSPDEKDSFQPTSTPMATVGCHGSKHITGRQTTRICRKK